jgi:hypothetical protein
MGVIAATPAASFKRAKSFCSTSSIAVSNQPAKELVHRDRSESEFCTSGNADGIAGKHCAVNGDQWIGLARGSAELRSGARLPAIQEGWSRDEENFRRVVVFTLVLRGTVQR